MKNLNWNMITLIAYYVTVCSAGYAFYSIIVMAAASTSRCVPDCQKDKFYWNAEYSTYAAIITFIWWCCSLLAKFLLENNHGL